MSDYLLEYDEYQNTLNDEDDECFENQFADQIDEEVSKDIARVLKEVNNLGYYIETPIDAFTELALMFNTNFKTVHYGFVLAEEMGIMEIEFDTFSSVKKQTKKSIKNYARIMESRFLIEFEFIERACMMRDDNNLKYISNQIETTFLTKGVYVVEEQFNFYLTLANSSAHKTLAESYEKMRADIVQTAYVAVFNGYVKNLQRNIMYIGLYEAIDDGKPDEALMLVEIYKRDIENQKILAINLEV